MRLRHAAVFALLLGSAVASAQSPPFTPPSAATVLLEVRRPRLPGAAPLEQLRAAATARPDWLPAASAYARAALELAKREDDPRYLGMAQSALAHWWGEAQPPPEVLQLRAGIRLARRDFAPARADLSTLVAAHAPEAPGALLSRAGLSLTEGEPAAALADCTAAAQQVAPLPAATCLAAAQSLGPKGREALAALEAAITAHPDAPLASALWAASTAAEIALRLGDAGSAGRHFNAALARADAAQTRDPGLLAAWADFQLDARQPQAVLTRLKGQERLDGLLLRLLLAERQLARSGDARAGQRALAHETVLVQRFAEQRARGDISHQREQTLFAVRAVNDPAAALAAAQRNWALQKEPVDARLLLEAASAAGNAAAAQPVRDWLARTGLVDARLPPQ